MGSSWRWATARSQAARLLAARLAAWHDDAGGCTYFITPPKTLPVDEFFHTQTGRVAHHPVRHHRCAGLRGGLLSRVPAARLRHRIRLAQPAAHRGARARWQTTTTLTPAALIFSALLTSIFFALLHFQQVAHLWAALLVLFSISLLLTFVRIKTGSVAASVLVHGAYNGFVFLMVIVQTGGYRHLERMTQ
jgi:hypothetical protein